VFHDNVGIAQNLDIESHKKTTIMEYFETNKVDFKARKISYANFLGISTWNNMAKMTSSQLLEGLKCESKLKITKE
jgi:hypothetical protein